MDIGAWAYAAFLVWLAAGFLDFVQHRRSDLAHTSGLGESTLHGLQLLLLGAAVLAWLAFAPSLLLAAGLLLLMSAHALAGYADTRVAFPRRLIGPFEQHLHSVLDMAPWFAWIVLAATGADAAREAGWTLAWQAAPPRLWLATLLPPLLLCVLPWAVEYRMAWRARAARSERAATT